MHDYLVEIPYTNSTVAQVIPTVANNYAEAAENVLSIVCLGVLDTPITIKVIRQDTGLAFYVQISN